MFNFLFNYLRDLKSQRGDAVVVIMIILGVLVVVGVIVYAIWFRDHTAFTIPTDQGPRLIYP